MTNVLVSFTLLTAVLIRWSASEGDNADSFLIENQSESDEEQLINDKWKKIELDDNDDALLEYFHSLRRQNERQDIISDPSALPNNDEWRREKRLHCCRKYCRCCPYKCRWICPLC